MCDGRGEERLSAMGEDRRGYLSLLLFGVRTSLDLTLSRNTESLFMLCATSMNP
jgi:hypothetical protein